MPEPGTLLVLALLVLALTALLVVAAGAVTVVGAHRSAAVRQARLDLHAGGAAGLTLPRLRRLVLDLAPSRSPADVRRLLPDAGLQLLRAEALGDLRSRSWRTRLRAAEVLGAIGPAEPLVRLLDDDVPVVRAAACSGVGPGSDPPVLRRAAALLGDPDAGVRHAAGDALARCGSRAADALAHLLAQPLPDAVRADALVLAAGPGAGPLVPHAESAADDPSSRVRSAAAHALAAVGDPSGRLRSLILDRDPVVAAAACRAAGALRDAGLAAPLAQGLRSSSWDVRTAAAAALAALGPPGILVLRAEVSGSDGFARDASLAALGLAAAPVLR